MEVPRSKCSIFLESLKELQKGKEEEGRLSARLRYDCTTAEKDYELTVFRLVT